MPARCLLPMAYDVKIVFYNYPFIVRYRYSIRKTVIIHLIRVKQKALR
jgi:hypothetical protein